tara:strand:+ start:822 stop:1019 length:198 start_codon:yes stop_codon:yes gene_type:complete
MAKWSGVYLEDCHTLLKKIEKDLANAWKTKKGSETDDDLLALGRTIYANELIEKIKKWRKEMYNE